MALVAVVGGHGKIALALHPLLVGAGHTPVALVRSEDYRAELEGLGAEVRLLNIENSTAGDFAAVFDGCEAVVFSAGGGPDGNIERKRTVDLEGSLKSIEGSGAAGIRRFVQGLRHQGRRAGGRRRVAGVEGLRRCQAFGRRSAPGQ